MTRQATRATRHSPRARLAAALRAAGLATGALSANPPEPEAQEPGDPSTSASTTVAAPPDPSSATVQARRPRAAGRVLGDVAARGEQAVAAVQRRGIPILGHQGDGSIADVAIRRLLMLQGTMKPHQIISLMTYPGADNTLAMGDHADHIHVGFQVPALSAALHVRAQDCRSCRARTSDPSRPSPRQR